MERISLYCDGGCRGNQEENNVGGWGAFLHYKGNEKMLSGGDKNTTNNKMELRGCIEGLKAIKNKNMGVDVYLDSAYVLNGITSWIDGWIKKGWVNSKKETVKNKELWLELLNEKNQFKDINFIKVKGHSGNPGNEVADMLCNKEMDLLGGK